MLPAAIATWDFGLGACGETYRRLESGEAALDAVEAGIRITEDDPAVASVGYGGRPNSEGIVELDAAVMLGSGRRYGAVAALRGFAEAITVARMVMERTDHNFLVGEASTEFAVRQGLRPQPLLTEERRIEWEEWRSLQQPPAHSHDTVCVLALDSNGVLCAGTSTSGIAYKLPGRVGDSPLVGCGLYCDQEVGAAAATGPGEIIMRYVMSFRIVEQMRRGASAQEACASTMLWAVYENPVIRESQTLGVIALDVSGDHGAVGSREGFRVAIGQHGTVDLNDAKVG